MRFLGLIIALLIYLTPSTALAQKQPNLNLTSAQIEELENIRCGWQTVDKLLFEGFISNTEASKIKASYTAKLKSLSADLDIGNLDLAQITQYQKNVNSFKQSLKGLFSFTNILATASSFLLAIAIGSLISLYLLLLLKVIPLVVYESVLYGIILAAIASGYWLVGATYQYVLLSTCLSLGGMLGFSYWQHKSSWQQLSQKIGLDIFSLCTLFLFLVWSAVAIAYQNVAIAFLAVCALEAFLGFAVAITPLTYIIGFRSRAVIFKTTIISLLLLVVYIAAQITNTTLPYLDIFAPAIKYIGSFVYFLGLLIVSSKWYFRQNFNFYLLMQGITVVSGVTALYVSSIWHISILRGVSGTLFTLYAIEKYIELPWTRKNWVWATLGFSIILYVCTRLIRSYPELFLIY